MALHFAYGSNMSVALMRTRCPGAEPVGIAELAGWRFLINREGYATIAPRAGASVHGVLWRVGARDLAALNRYEAVDVGLYRRRTLAVACNGHRRVALIYIARDAAPGRPRRGYLPVVIEAAHTAGLPARYLDELRRWSESRWQGARSAKPGDLR